MNYDNNDDYRSRAEYVEDKFSEDNRDHRDEAIRQRERRIITRHEEQLASAREAENNDTEWVRHRGKIQSLEDNIKVRQANYDTYMNSMNIEKTLYNRERHRTLLLGIANVAALAGCVAMWSP